MATTTKLVELFNAFADASLVDSTATAFVEAAYENLLGLSGDFSNKDARVAYWVEQIEGGVALADFANTFLTAAAVQGDLLTDAEFAANGVALAAIEALDETDLTLDAVKAAVLESAEEEEEEGNAGATFELTKSTTIPDVPAMTSGDDTVTAAAGTLESSDIISDASAVDADTLTATVNSNNLTTRLTNVETVNLEGQYATTGLDLQNVTGTKTVNLSTEITAGTATLTNVSAAATAGVVAGTNVGTLSVTAAAAGTGGNVMVDAGAATSVTVAGGNGNDTYTVDAVNASSITLNGGTGTDTITLNVDGGSVGSFDTDVSAVETLTINSTTAASTLTLADADVLVGTSTAGSGLVVTGDQDLTISGDLDAFEGVSVTDSSSATTTITVTANTTAASDVSAAAVDVLNLTVNSGAGALVVNENTLVKLGADNTATSINIDNAAGNLTTGTLKLAVNTGQTTLVTAAKVDTLDIAADVANVAIATLTLNAATNTVVLSGEKSVTIGGTALTNAAGDVFSAENLAGSLTISNFAASAVVLGGANDDSITLTDFDDFIVRSGEGNDTVNGSALTGTNNATIFGGAGDDNISGGAGADIIDAGEGNDFIDAGVGADALTGGAGVDIFSISVADSTTTATDAISDYSGDVLRFLSTDSVAGATTSAAVATTSVEVSAGGKVTFHANDDTLAEKLVALNADTTNVALSEAVFFEHGSDTYVFVQAATDILVKLTGVTDLTTMTESVVTAGDFTIA